MKKIILASGSPRRKEILTSAQIEFEIVKSKYKENNPSLYNENLVKENSLNKALDVLSQVGTNCLVISADTVVILDSVCLVKPHNIYEAFFMLKSLSNRTHKVVTAHSIVDSDTKKSITEISTSNVTFRKLNWFEIIYYILTKNHLDKAGSYGIQDFLNNDDIVNIPKNSFVKEISGSYYNIMGLDIDLILDMLNQF